MKKYKCNDCAQIFKINSKTEEYCPKCYSNSVRVIEDEKQKKADFDIEDLLNNQYGCRGGCSCS